MEVPSGPSLRRKASDSPLSVVLAASIVTGKFVLDVSPVRIMFPSLSNWKSQSLSSEEPPM